MCALKNRLVTQKSIRAACKMHMSLKKMDGQLEKCMRHLKKRTGSLKNACVTQKNGRAVCKMHAPPIRMDGQSVKSYLPIGK